MCILEKAFTQQEHIQAVEAWANLLGVMDDDPNRRAVRVAELVHAMHRELDLVAAGLAEAHFSKRTYENAFARIEQAISPLMLTASWIQVKQNLTPDVLTALTFCAEILSDEESQISTDELEDIRQKVEELRATVDDAETPLRLRQLIQHHIELIDRALSEYLIVGAKALRDARRAAMGEIFEVKDELAPFKSSSAFSKLSSAWATLSKATDVALKGEKLVQLVHKGWEALSDIL
ncbi:hypothetical protein B472_06115 [Limnohabitans sp. Rim28]|nr:hypothetical protein B472_06115 [Limnohabitans sp. Rim28]